MSVWELIKHGGFTMYPLLICSLFIWAVIFERLWRYSRINRDLRSFHLEAQNVILKNDPEALRSLCARHPDLPTSKLVGVAIARLGASDDRVRSRWVEAVERARLMQNLEVRRYLWILGTIGSAAPFIGLFGTVVGILQSFQDMAKSGSGGFAVVAAGISEALVATAAGIVVAVIAVMAFNAFQVRAGNLITVIKSQTEELLEVLETSGAAGPRKA